MKATGIVRRIDDLGRVVIPKEIRRTMRIREGDPLEIFTDNDGEVIFKKYSPIGELSEFAGQYAEALFAIGLVAASFLAACVLPLTTAFVICEAFGWEAGVSFKWREAPMFKSIFTFVIIIGAVVVLIPNVNLMGIMLTAQFVNGIILPVLLVFMAIIASDKHIMGAFKSSRLSQILIWVTVAIVTVLTVALLVMQVLGIE